MGRTRGFVTVATGDYYCWLAENLAMSYRLFADEGIPLALITDEAGKRYFRKHGRNHLFDEVIVSETPNYSYLDKLYVYELTPYDETIYIDADIHITDSISTLFDKFGEVASPISVYGWEKPHVTGEPTYLYGNQTFDKLNLSSYIAFNGGIYYFRKSQEADKAMSYIFEQLIPRYDELALKRFNGNKADEPLLGLTMMMHGFRPYEEEGSNYMRLISSLKGLRWDMQTRRCLVDYYGEPLHTEMIHYGTPRTYSLLYLRLSLQLQRLYHNSMLPARVADYVTGYCRFGTRLAKRFLAKIKKSKNKKDFLRRHLVGLKNN